MADARVNPVDDALVVLAGPAGAHDIERALSPLGGPLDEQFMRAVSAHRLDGALADALRRSDRPIPTRLQEVIADDRLIRLRVGAALGRIAPLLDDADIDWLTFKGPMISELMERPELRTFNDLDILVAADRLGDAIDVLIEAGGRELNRNWLPYVRHRVGEVPMEAQGVTIDLHWHVIGLGRHRRSVKLAPADMLERRRRRPIRGLQIPAFDAEDQLIHLAVHSAMSGATRLDQLRDLTVVLETDPVDWQQLADRARQASVARLIAHALDRASRVLGASIDHDVVDRLGGRLLALRRQADGDRVSNLRAFTVVSSRDSALQTLGACAGRLQNLAAVRVGLARGWDFTDEHGLLYHATDSGGPAVRADFLRSVPGWL